MCGTLSDSTKASSAYTKWPSTCSAQPLVSGPVRVSGPMSPGTHLLGQVPRTATKERQDREVLSASDALHILGDILSQTPSSLTHRFPSFHMFS